MDSGRGGGTVLSPCLNVRGVWTVVGVVGWSWGKALENIPHFPMLTAMHMTPVLGQVSGLHALSQ